MLVNCTPTALTFFSGAGGACSGLQQAGFKIIGGNEWIPAIADIWDANHPGLKADRRSILEINPAELPNADLHWFSPPCPEYSVAKKGRTGGTDKEDTTIAEAIARIIQTRLPRWVVIENVRGYDKSHSKAKIAKALENAGYQGTWKVVNAADFGVPQTRDRLIGVFELGATPKFPEATHTEWPTGQVSLFAPALLPWVGWHEAIADLLPGCDRTYLTPNQLQAIGPYLGLEKLAPLLVDGKASNYGSTITIRNGRSPSYSIVASADRQLSRAVLIQRTGYSTKQGPQAKLSHELSPTITCSQSSDARDGGSFRSGFTAAVPLPGGLEAIALKIDNRCLARLQGFPDSHQWPGKAGLIARAIGNAVPPAISKAVGQALLFDALGAKPGL